MCSEESGVWIQQVILDLIMNQSWNQMVDILMFSTMAQTKKEEVIDEYGEERVLKEKIELVKKTLKDWKEVMTETVEE